MARSASAAAVGLLQFGEGHVLVAEACRGVLVARRAGDDVRRAGVHAGEARVAAKARLRAADGFAALERDAPGRTRLGAYPAADAPLGVDGEKVPQRRGLEAQAAAHELLVGSTILVGHRLEPLAAHRDVRSDARKVLADLLLGNASALLVHVEVGQPVVNHEERGHVGGVEPRRSRVLQAQLDGIGVPVSVGADEVEVGSVERRAVDELPHHVGHHVTVDGVDDADRVIRVDELAPAAHLLRDAQDPLSLCGQLTRRVEAVARPGEV